MSRKRNLAIEKINKNGLLLVYPIKNKKEPASLWSEFYPRSNMNWSWDEDGDDRVMQMWMLMKELSDCGDVVYSKWYRGRATFFSKEIFVNLLAYTHEWRENSKWSPTAKDIYEILQNDSPLSTKVLKKHTGLIGKDFASEYDRAMRFLYQRFYIVSFGEVADGAFLSSAMGATSLLFEDLWMKAMEIPTQHAKKNIDKFMKEGSETRKFLNTLLKKNQ